MKRSPTMADVARKAGVSTMTVSRVVRGMGGVNPETAARVRSCLRRMRFRPDPLLGALAGRRRGRRSKVRMANLALVTPGDDESVWESVVTYRENVAGAVEAARRLGYGFERICAGRTAASWASALKILQARGVRGVLLPPVRREVPPEVKFVGFSGVNMGFGHRRTGFHIVRHDLYEMTTLALQELVGRGFDRLGVVATRDEERSDYQVTGAALAFGRTGGGRNPVRPPLLLPEAPADFSEVSRERFQQWVDRERPDVILGLQGQLYGSWLKAEGVRIPRDVAIVVLNLCEEGSGPRPQFAGVGITNRQIGVAAVEKVHGMIARGETGRPAIREIVTLAARWIDGPSVPKKKGTRKRPR